MQSFDTEPNDIPKPSATAHELIVGATADLPPGACTTIQLPSGEDVAVYNVDGEYYAIENSCPHRGAPLSDGTLCGHVIECALHGWEFDVRTGDCLTVADTIKTYPLKIEAGMVRLVLD